ncbi:MAG: Ldh family oxidoreductase [Anaerolineales bacterium]|jgi:uncharacterized oxidoreductase
MPVFSTDYLRDVGIRIFTACGAPADEAKVVADNLVEASLMGLESHGVTRYIHYVDHVLIGKIKPGAPVRVVKETPTTAIVDCGFNFGMVSAKRMVEIVCEKAQEQHVACVVSQNSHHVSRLGSYVQMVTERDLIGIATANSSQHGHFVVPFGGREGRLATNPIAYGIPTREGPPVLLDMSTSMISEGKIQVLMHEGKPIPPGSVQDAEGYQITAPEKFYGPPKGTIMPFGSPELGYKGFGLSLMVEILSGVLGGNSTPEDLPYINGLFIIAIDPQAFCGLERFKDLIEVLKDYMKTTPPAPGYDEVIMPGELDFRIREKRLVEGIPLADKTWDLIKESALKVGVNLEEPESQR